MQGTNYLDSGIYTIPEAAALVGVSTNKIRGWLRGYKGSRQAPIIRPELPRLGRQAALGFRNLIEARFIKGFVKHGVSPQAVRVMADEARTILRDEHPFSRDVLFKTDGKAIFAEIWDRASQKTELYDLQTHNWALEKILAPFLKEPVQFDHEGNASLWHPRREVAPHVVVTPGFAFGRPVLEGSGTPTDVLVDALVAENYNYQEVSKWYEVSVEEIKEAEKFQTLLYGTA